MTAWLRVGSGGECSKSVEREEDDEEDDDDEENA